MAELRDRLAACGFQEPELDAKVRMFERVMAAHGDRASRAMCWWVPGRLEFLGKHTDYAGGRSLLCAVERGFAVAATRRADAKLEIVDAASGERAIVEITPDLAAPAGHWLNYPLTVARRVARNFGAAAPITGATIAFESDLPAAAGLSSSSALIVATFLALAEVNDLSARPEYRAAIGDRLELAAYLGAVENGSGFRTLPGDRGVGTTGGSEDHVAILCSRPGVLGQYHFAPLRQEDEIPLPPDHTFVITDSGVVAPKTGSAMASYNRLAASAAAALDLWRRTTASRAPSLGAALAEYPGAYEEMCKILAGRDHPDFTFEELHGRVYHFWLETTFTIPGAVAALRKHDWEELGHKVDVSQRDAEYWLRNQVPETIALARSAHDAGAIAASAFGAGFGGSVYALVRHARFDFAARWLDAYRARLPEPAAVPRCFLTRAGPGATRI